MAVNPSKYRVHEIFLDLEYLRNKDNLIGDWLDENTQLSYCYDEFVSRLFDDYWFEDFAEEQARNIGFGEILIEQLILFKDMLENYDKKVSENKWMDDRILADPDFDQVLEQVKKAVELWEKDQEAAKYINVE